VRVDNAGNAQRILDFMYDGGLYNVGECKKQHIWAVQIPLQVGDASRSIVTPTFQKSVFGQVIH